MKLLTTFLILSISLQALACPSHKSVSKGYVVECNGAFFNQATEQSIRKDVRDNQLRKKQIELKDLQLSKITDDRDKWKVEAEKQAKLKHRKDNDMRNGIITGVVMTLAVMFAARQVGK